ncbi:hypothetical protein HNO89_001356 [Sporosarcina luteola]|nr:hypothetical protein [Sporosarcina luteola]
MVVLRNDIFKKTVIEYLEYKGRDELAQILKSCDFMLSDTGNFTYKIWNQTKLELDIRVPLPLMKKAEESWEAFVKACMDVYPDDDKHSLLEVRKGIKIAEVIEVQDGEGTADVSIPGGQIYHNLIAKVHKEHIDSIEKDYILEACYCAQRGYRLAAATMIGCAAERLLLQLCEAYLVFLKNGGGSEREAAKFEEEVVNAKKAHARLDGFLRRAKINEDVFKSIGLENSDLHFSFLDIVRQVRNESGHPTGIKISEEDLGSIFANYQLLIDRVHPVIVKLPTYQTQ